MNKKDIENYLKETLLLAKKNKNKYEKKLRKIIYLHQNKIPALAAICLLTGVLLVAGIIKSPVRSLSVAKLNQSINTSLSSDAPDLNNLNFKNIEKFEVPNAKATVIYIPQLHKEPTSNASDKTNDQATTVQKEISGMLKTLVDDNHVKYVMDETDLYGSMPADKVEKIKAGFSEIEGIRSDIKTIIEHYLKDGGSTETADAVQKSVDEKLDGYERNIYLTGGAAVLAAQDDDAHVYGSQNADTINEAKVELQNLVYMEARIKELEAQNGSGSIGTTSTSSSSQSSAASILSALGSSSKSNGSSLQPIINFAKKNNDTELIEEISKITSASKAFTSSRSYETTSATSTTTAPVNVYKNVTDLEGLKEEYQTAYNKFMKLAKDQRSQEVADNIDKMMEENGQNTSILVFGMQHKDQLVTALNKKNINVIVITPESE
ncbi:MAG: hypothetical protein WC536_04010 [Patescibacteria group bacterium]